VHCASAPLSVLPEPLWTRLCTKLLRLTRPMPEKLLPLLNRQPPLHDGSCFISDCPIGSTERY